MQIKPTMMLKEFFVLHGKEFRNVNCEVDDEGVNLCPIVVYEEGSKFRNVDPKEFENVMNKACQNSKQIWNPVKALRDFQKHHGFPVDLNIVDLLE